MRTSFYPYPPRPGANYEALDFSPPDEAHRLGPEELQSVFDFERQLYAANLDPIQYPSAEAYRHTCESAGTPVEPLEAVWSKKVHIAELATDYFLTDEGREAFTALSGGRELEAETIEEATQALSSLDISGIDSKTLDKIEADSTGFEERRLTQAFIESGFDGEAVPKPEFIALFKNPEVILEKARGYRQLKTYITKAMGDIRSGANNEQPEVTEAKLLLASLYRRRINLLIADKYVDAYKFLRQNQLGGGHEGLIQEIGEVLPVYFGRDDPDRTARFLQRMDRYQEGVSVADDGTFTWLSPEAQALVDEAEQDREPSAVDRGVYADIDPADLERVTIDSETFGEWLRDVVAEYGLLSEHTDWDSERTEPAPDGLWQIIVHDKFKSLAVNDKQRVMKVPAKEISLLFAITLANHEITHILQHHNKRRIAQLAISQRVGIDNAMEQTESGGKWQERVSREGLTGQEDLDINGTSYMRGLEVKSRGGTFGQGVEAYYRDLLSRNPDKSPEKLAAQAVNRTRRLYRGGGHAFAHNRAVVTNTQPLNYLEQQLIYRGLDDEQRKLLFVAGVTIANALQLSRTGIIDLEQIFIPDQMPWELLHDKAKAEIESQPSPTSP